MAEIVGSGTLVARKTVTPTYETIVPVSGQVSDNWKDWTPRMQDQLLAAIAAIPVAQELNGGRYERQIVKTSCERDPDGWFVRVIVMDMRIYV